MKTVKLIKTVSFLAVFGMTGFVLGTLTLLYPVRWMVNFAKAQQASKSLENTYVNITIGLFVLISLITAIYLHDRIFKLKNRLYSVLIYLLVIACCAGTLYYWLNPDKFQQAAIRESLETSAGVSFYFGSYPDEQLMRRLKSDDFKGVISLLHPAVVPFEPKLINDEEKLAEKVGIELYLAPMLPWVSKNEEALQTILNIADTATGKFYVHCYLGVDRTNLVKTLISNRFPKVAVVNQMAKGARLLDTIETFERGKIIKLHEGVFLTPYPTDEEFVSFILSGQIKTVVSLLDPSNPDDNQWIKKEEELMTLYRQPYVNIPINLRQKPEEIRQGLSKILDLQRPLVVHAYNDRSPGVAELTDWYPSLMPLRQKDSLTTKD